MPAARTKRSASATNNPIQSAKRTSRKTAANGDLKENGIEDLDLGKKVEALRNGKAWSDIVQLVNSASDQILSLEIQSAFCRAFFHEKEPSEELKEKAKSTSEQVLKVKSDSVDGLLAAGKLAQLEGDSKGLADKALEAFKASQYKDEDALSLMQSSQGAGQSQEAHAQTKDHYEILHIARGAPEAVIKAAHSALSHPEGSAEAKAADEALAVLTNPEQRTKYDEALSRRKTAGGGREFSGGSEILKQLGEALGLVFPEGFVFPPTGRFQGGFGGGFEFTWGESENEKDVKQKEEEDSMVVDQDAPQIE